MNELMNRRHRIWIPLCGLPILFFWLVAIQLDSTPHQIITGVGVLIHSVMIFLFFSKEYNHNKYLWNERSTYNSRSVGSSWGEFRHEKFKIGIRFGWFWAYGLYCVSIIFSLLAAAGLLPCNNC